MILHIDMDAFFAAVEQRDNPELQNKPVIVSGSSPRSVVTTASYEARKFGIGSAMPVFKAKEKCDHLEIVPVNRQKYVTESRKIMQVLSKFTPLVEPLSIDEAYLDITGCQRLFGSFHDIAGTIKKEIYNEVALTCSIGMAPLKFLAKIASDMNKPDGLTIIDAAQVPEFINQLPIARVPGIGKRSMKQMLSLQITYLGDVKKYPLPVLQKKLGKMGKRLLELANGIDQAGVEPSRARKSISSERTLSTDIAAPEAVKKVLLAQSQTVGRTLRKKQMICQSVSIKLKFTDFTQITRSCKCPSPVSSSSAIYHHAVELFEKVKLKKKLRLIGVGVSALKDKHTPVQMLLIPDEEVSEKQWESVDKATDSIYEKFGRNSINKASLKETGKNSS